MEKPKRFFTRPKIKEVLEKELHEWEVNSLEDLVKLYDFIDEDIYLSREHAVVIKSEWIENLTNEEKLRKLYKHGPELKLSLPQNQKEFYKNPKEPIYYIEEAVRKFREKPFRIVFSYSWTPIYGKDKIKRKVSLVALVKGAKIYIYTKNFSPQEELKEYSAMRSVVEGKSVIVKVPSRTQKRSNYEIKYNYVPFENTKEHKCLAFSISTEGHGCGDKLFKNIAFKYLTQLEHSRFVMFCPHEIAGYFLICDYYYNIHRNAVPYYNMPFLVPTNYTLTLSRFLEENMLITRNTKSGKRRFLREVEMELFYWLAVYKHGLDKTFKRKEKLKNAIELFGDKS